MTRKVSQEILDTVWAALNDPPKPGRPMTYRRILNVILERGWLYSYQLEDLAMSGEVRLDDRRNELDLKDLATALGYHWRHTAPRPRVRTISVIYNEGMPVSDATSFLLTLERLGFDFDPEPLLQELRPKLLKQKILTDSELDIFWEKSRHRSETLLESADGPRNFGEYREGKFTNGYRFTALFRKDGSIFSLGVRGSKHRARRDPVKTQCADCGHTWYRGDPDSSAAHRKEHKERMHILDPKPHETMIEERSTHNDPELVTSGSPEWKHREIFRRAQAFKREKGYDFTQWHSAERDDDPHVHGFLFTDEDGVINGACAFRWRVPSADQNHGPFWGLQWVWVCPRYRRNGVLSSRWAMLRERFGDFFVEGPVSESMQAFLCKKGDAGLMHWPADAPGWEKRQSADEVSA